MDVFPRPWRPPRISFPCTAPYSVRCRNSEITVGFVLAIIEYTFRPHTLLIICESTRTHHHMLYYYESHVTTDQPTPAMVQYNRNVNRCRDNLHVSCVPGYSERVFLAQLVFLLAQLTLFLAQSCLEPRWKSLFVI